MTLIQIILIVTIVGSAMFLLGNLGSQKARAWKRIMLGLLVLFMVIVILLPDITNEIAHAVGVGRGADLLLYGLVVSFVGFVINVYIKFQQQRDKIYELARKQAILEAELRHAKPKQ